MNRKNPRIQLVLFASIIAFQIGIKQKVQATPVILLLPVERTTGLGCIPESKTVSYECTVTDDNGGSSTLWKGSAFNCSTESTSTNNMISLLHQYFCLMSGSSGNCGDTFSAISVTCNASMYTSQLNLTATTELDGQIIECSRSGINPHAVKDTIKVGVYPPPPGPLLVFLSNSDSFFTVSWIPPPYQSNINGYLFLVTGENCGCESMNVSVSTTSVSCSGWMARGQNCSFEVRTISQDCGFTSDPVNKTVTLSIPSIPTNLTVRPVYNRSGGARHIDIHFTAVDELSIGANISVAVSYTVMIGSLSSTGVQCNQQCNLTVLGSQLKEDGLLNISVVASNAVGSGGPANFPTPVAANIVTQAIASVTIDVLQSIVTCNLLPSYQQTPNAIFSITYGPSPDNCSLMFNSTFAISNSSSILHLTKLDVEEYCYTVKLDHGSTVLSITGTFRSECDPQLLGTDPPKEGSVTVPNGVINYNGLAPGSVVTLVCNEGYSVANETNRTCMSDGHWSDETLECIKDPTPARCGEACGIATGVSVFGVMLILIVFCVIMALYLFFKYRKVVCAVNAKIVDSEASITNQNNVQAELTLTAQNDSAPCDKPQVLYYTSFVLYKLPCMSIPLETIHYTFLHLFREVILKPQVEMYADPINLVPPSDGKKSSQRQVEMYADPDDIIPTPQLPPRNYDEGEHHMNVPVQDTGQSKLVEEATKPNSSQLPQELYSEVFNALPKGMAPKVVRNGTKN